MQNIQEKLQKGYEINNLELYENTFKDYKKMLLTTVLALALVFAIFFGISMIGLMFYLSYYNITPDQASEALAQFNLADLSQQQLLAYYGINVFATALFGVVSAGFLKLAQQVHQGHLPQLSAVFYYFVRKEGFFVFSFLLFIEALIASFSYYIQAYDLLLVSFVVQVIVKVLTILVVPLLLFSKAPFFKAIQWSLQLVNQQPLRMLSLVSFFYIFSLFGVFFFLIGVVFTLPILYAFTYNLYVQIIEKN